MTYTWDQTQRHIQECAWRGDKRPAESFAERRHDAAVMWRVKGCLAAARESYYQAAWAYDLIGRNRDAAFCRSRAPEADENGRITEAAIRKHELEMGGGAF